MYYSQKGVDGGLVRKINEGMSSRVKNDAAFANTRRNAAEFGALGSFSGVAISAISKRWRTILDPFATGKLSRDLAPILRSDNTNPWGQRGLNFVDTEDAVKAKISSYAKNQYSENFATGIVFDRPQSGGVTITGTTTAATSEGLLSRGAKGVVYEYYVYGIQFGGFDSAAGSYLPSENYIRPIGSVDAEIGQVTDLGVTSLVTLPEGGNELISTVLVVALPYKTVGNVKYTLQEMCSFTLL